MPVLGTAVLDIYPSLKGIQRELQTQLEAPAEQSGARAGLSISKALRGALSGSLRDAGKGMGKEAQDVGDDAGESLSKAFAKKWRSEDAKEAGNWKSRMIRTLNDSSVADAAGRSGSNLGKKLTGGIEKETSKAGKAGNGGGGLMGGLLSGAGMGIGMGAFGAVTAGLSQYVGQAVEASDSTQKFAKSLEFAKVSAPQIAALTTATQSYADKTVYDLAGIRSTTASFAASGVKDAQTFTEALGNLNAIAGGTSETFGSVAMASTQIMGAGKLTTENWGQIRDQVPGGAAVVQKALQDAGAYTGNFNEAMTKGQISAQEFQAAITKVGMTDVAKEAAQSSTTIEGAMGNFEASVVGGMGKVVTATTPAVTALLNFGSPIVTKAFDGVVAGITKAGDILKPFADGLGQVENLLATGDFSKPIFGQEEDSQFIGTLFDARDGLSGIKSILADGDFSKPIFHQEEDSKFVEVLFRIRDGFKEVKQFASDFAAGFTLGDNAAQFGELEAGVAAGNQFYNLMKGLSTWMTGTFIPAAAGVFQSLAGYWGVAISIAGEAVSGMIGRVRPLLPEVKAVFASVGGAVRGAMDLVSTVIKVATDVIRYVWKRWGDSIMNYATAAFRIVLGAARGFSTMLSGLFKLISSVLTGNWSGMWAGLKQIASGAVQVLKAAFNLLWTSIKAMFNSGTAVVKVVFDNMWKGLKSLASSGWDWIKSKTLTPMVDFFKVTIPDAATKAKDGFGKAWDGIKSLASKPVKAIVDTVWNDGIVSLAGKAGLGDVFNRVDFKGFWDGGYTGPGRKKTPKGVVHGNEYVLTSDETDDLGGPGGVEKWKAAALQNAWPVGPAGELPGASQNTVTPAVPTGIPGGLREIIRRGPRGTGGEGGPVENGLAQLGNMGWYRRCLAFVNAAWGHSVQRLGMATARQSMNAGPLQQGVPPAGAAAYYNTSGYAGHVALGMGDGSVLSNDIVVPGRIDRVPYNIFASKWGAPYTGYFMPGGGASGKMSAAWNTVKGFAGSAVNKVGDTWDQFKGKLSGLASTKLPGGEPWLSSVAGVPKKLVEATKSKLEEAWGSVFGGGGRGYAQGTLSAPGGWAMVGERGPEMVRLPSASKVIPNHQLAKAGATQELRISGTLDTPFGPAQVRGVALEVAEDQARYDSFWK